MGGRGNHSQRHVAFLRGMNLGGRRITNERLARAFTGAGYRDVAVFLASGNVIFSSHRAVDETTIATALHNDLGYPVPTLLRSDAQVCQAAAHEPFSAQELAPTAGKVQVVFTRAPQAQVKEVATQFSSDEDLLRAHGGNLYWLPRIGVSAADLDIYRLESQLGTITVRSHNTVKRLVSKFFAA